MSNSIVRDWADDQREKAPEFPPELALKIVRKAQRMSAQFEEQALDTMIRAARRALRDGTDQRTIVRQMQL